MNNTKLIEFSLYYLYDNKPDMLWIGRPRSKRVANMYVVSMKEHAVLSEFLMDKSDLLLCNYFHNILYAKLPLF